MSRKWALIQIAKEFNFLVRPDAVFGQHRQTSQLFAVEAYDSLHLTLRFTLKHEIDKSKLAALIEIFNKRRKGYAQQEPGSLKISGIPSFSLFPQRSLSKLRETISWWCTELSKLQTFDTMNSIALYPFGPFSGEKDDGQSAFDSNQKQLEQIDNFKSFKSASVGGLFASIFIGFVAAIAIEKIKFNIPFIEAFLLLGILGKSFKSKTQIFNKASSLLILMLFALLFPFEQITKYAVYVSRKDPNLDFSHTFENALRCLSTNYQLPVMIWLMLSGLLLIPLLRNEKFVQKEGVQLTDEHIRNAAFLLAKKQISTWSALSIAEFPLWVPGDFLKGDRPESLLAS